MKRNVVAWAALVVSSAALVSSQGFLRPLPAAPKVSSEGQKTARALSEAYGAVADFVKPSVVQISVKLKTPSPRMQGRRQSPPNGPQMPDLNDLFEEFLRRNSALVKPTMPLRAMRSRPLRAFLARNWRVQRSTSAESSFGWCGP